MSAVSALGPARAAAERRMRDTVTIRRPGSRGAFDPETGEYDTTDGAVVYEGKCRFRRPPGAAGAGDAGDHAYEIPKQDLCLPVSAAAVVKIGDVGLLTASPDSPGNVGRRFRIDNDALGSQTTDFRPLISRIGG